MGFQQMKPVPLKIQALLFKKILSYDKSEKSSEIKLYVLSDNSNSSQDTIITSFIQLGINTIYIKNDKLTQVESNSILYVTSSNKRIADFCNSNNILCISGTPDDVVNNKAAISLYVENNKPKIIVNLPVLKDQQHDLSSDVLKLAKIVGAQE